jgi:MFS family permease
MGEVPHFLTEALRFQDPRRNNLRKVSDAEWSRVLSDWNVVRLTLPLRQVCGDELPDWVRERIDAFFADNALRFERIKDSYVRAAKTIEEAGAEHVVLKGFSLWPGYTDHPKHRPQSDIDLYIPPETVFRARDALISLGYSSIHLENSLDKFPSDHLSTLDPPHSWKWQGNHFDPEIPISFELHFSWWDSATSRIHPQGLQEFWQRRLRRELDGISFPALDPVDNLGYTAINLLRHILRTYPATEQVYGLARFLHMHADDHLFWQRWRDLHHESNRRLQAISFRLATDWFACRLSDEVREEVDRLEPPVQAWFEHFLKSTLSTKFDKRKDGLWLHLNLVESRRDKLTFLFQRIAPVPILFPTIGPELGDAGIATPPASAPAPANPFSGLARCAHKSIKYAEWTVSRCAYHSVLLPRALWRGVGYQLARQNLGRPFWTFFAASFCFDLGMTMYFFLYNIYLLDRGFKENFLGLMISSMNIGSIACTIPAGILIQRFGIRRSLLLCIAMVSAASVARALFAPQSAILGLALLAGFLTTIWAVAISPAIALLTSEKSRPFGFSVVFSSGIGVGILANLAASRLPGFFMQLHPAISATQGKQIVLIIASAIVALALIPLSRLQIKSPPASERKLYPRNPFLLRFLPALALWSIVTGSLSPLANVYFSQYLHTPLVRMGTIFSFSNLFQVMGILVAPLLFRKLGIVSGVAYTQLAAALLLGLLAATSGALPAAVIYVSFSGCLWMSEPGMFSLLMGGVAPEERAGASALNFLVISLVQAGTVAATGASLARFGYPTVLGGIAFVAAIAALTFWGLLGRHVPMASNPAPARVDAR